MGVPGEHTLSDVPDTSLSARTALSSAIAPSSFMREEKRHKTVYIYCFSRLLTSTHIRDNG